MKLAGALLVIAGAFALGHLEALRRERRVRELTVVISALTLLQSHVVYGRSFLADALRHVGEEHPEVAPWFCRAARRIDEGEAASRAWREALAAWSRRSALAPGDVGPLAELAGILGLSAADDQARHLLWARTQLETRLAAARERLPERARMCRALGVCGGLLLALLLY